MGKIIFVLGGARSGKSAFALEMAKNSGTRVAFIATGEPRDEEMRKRIEMHRKSRPAAWKTFEVAREVSPVLNKIKRRFGVIIVDCATLLVSNLLLNGFSETRICGEFKKISKITKQADSTVIVVSNEVGLGIVPHNALARGFRDIVGRVNQIVAEEADEVFFIVAGIPSKISARNKWKA